jgi:hypothetical protein
MVIFPDVYTNNGSAPTSYPLTFALLIGALSRGLLVGKWKHTRRRAMRLTLFFRFRVVGGGHAQLAADRQ